MVSAKLGVPVVHVEAGLRSFDRTMPEEINRILTDSLSDLLFVSEPSGVQNLHREGIHDSKIHLVGNVMIDTLFREREAAQSLNFPASLGLNSGEYGLVTLHRPSNVDDPKRLSFFLKLLAKLAQRLKLVFPVHPRTKVVAEANAMTDLLPQDGSFMCIPPLSYRENLALMLEAKVVITDSGGMQEETTALKVPCLTLRDNTERPITIEKGTNCLVGDDEGKILEAFDQIMENRWTSGSDIPLWDGKAAERIVCILHQWIQGE